MGSRIRVRKNDRTLVDSGHRLNHLLIEGLGYGTDSDYRGWLNGLDGLHKILDWLMFVSIRLLEIGEIIARRFKQSFYVEEPGSRTSLFKRSLLHRH